jgi:hypothetical protein
VVTVHVVRRFVGGSRESIDLPDGSTFREAIAQAGLTGLAPPGVRVVAGDRAITPDRWDDPIPADAPVLIRRIPQDPATVIAVMTAIASYAAEAAAAIGTFLANVGVALAPAGLEGVAIGAGSSVAGFVGGYGLFSGLATFIVGAGMSGGIAYGIGAGLRALVPTPSNDLGRRTASPADSPTINGAPNSILRYQPVWRVYGTQRIRFPYAAVPYRRTFNGEQFFFGLFTAGYGPVQFDLTSLRIGDIALSEYSDVTVQVDDGDGIIWDVDVATGSRSVATRGLDVFTQDVTETEVGRQFYVAGQNDDNWVEPQDWAGAPIARSAPLVQFMECDFSFPTGIVLKTGTGHTHPLWLDFEVRIRRATQIGVDWGNGVGQPGNWFAPSIDTRLYGDLPNGRWGLFEVLEQTADYTRWRWYTLREGNQLAGIEIDAGAVGEWDVQIRKFRTYPGSGTKLGTAVWQRIRSIKPTTDPVPKSWISLLAVRIKASNQLNGALDQLSGIVTSKLRKYQGGAWTSPQPTSNPAWIYADILRGSATRRPISDNRIDVQRIVEFADFCEPLSGQYSWRFDGVFDFQSTVAGAIRDVLASARSTYIVRDGLHSVVIDKPQFAVGLVTPRNSSGTQGTFSFIDQPHAFRVRFLNADKDWEQDERVVYAQGYDETTARVFEDLQFFGVTTSDQVWKLADYHIRVAALRTGRYQRTMDWEYLGFERGDRVKLSDDVLLGDVEWGRIDSIAVNGSNHVTSIDLDTEVMYVPGESYGITIRTLDTGGTISAPAYSVTNPATLAPVKSKTITPTIPIPTNLADEQVVQVGQLLAFGLFGEEVIDAIVLSIQPSADASAIVTFTDYSEDVFNVGGAIPAFSTSIKQSRYARPPAPILGAPFVQNDTLFIPVSIESQSPEQVEAIWIHGQVRAQGGQWISMPTRPADASLLSVDWLTTGARYEIRVRTASGLGTYSSWVSTFHDMPDDVDIDVLDYRIVGLGLVNGSDLTVFRGRDAHFTWRLAHADGRDTIQNLGEAASLVGAASLQYVCQVLDAQTGQVVREQSVQTPGFAYTLSMQQEDPGPLRREFRFRVAFRDTTKGTGPWAETAVRNEAPAMLSPVYTPNIGGFLLEVAPPTDPDFAGIVVWSSQTPTVPLTAAAEVVRASTLPVSVRTPYLNPYIRCAAFDEFAFNPITGEIDASVLNVTTAGLVPVSQLISTTDIQPGAVTEIATLEIPASTLTMDNTGNYAAPVYREVGRATITVANIETKLKITVQINHYNSLEREIIQTGLLRIMREIGGSSDQLGGTRWFAGPNSTLVKTTSTFIWIDESPAVNQSATYIVEASRANSNGTITLSPDGVLLIEQAKR